MSEILESFDFKTAGRPVESKWDKFLDGRIHRLNGDDLGDMVPGNVRTALYKRATKKDLKVRVNSGRDYLVVQAYKDES